MMPDNQRSEEIEAILRQVLEALENRRQTHYYCEDTWYSCPKHEDGCANEAEGDECNCGADKANDEIDSAIAALLNAIANYTDLDAICQDLQEMTYTQAMRIAELEAKLAEKQDRKCENCGEFGPCCQKREHDMQDVRCECCGYMTHHREHLSCIHAAQPKRERVVFPTMLRQMWSGGEVQEWLDENVNKEPL